MSPSELKKIKFLFYNLLLGKTFVKVKCRSVKFPTRILFALMSAFFLEGRLEKAANRKS